MGDRSAIEWTDATWNPVTGCSHVSEGCRHCYAETLSLRMGWSQKPWSAQNARENVVLHPERLGQPLRWTRPRRVFVNSMSDLFHERIPDAFIAQVFAVMAAARHHVFQVLTKRPERMQRLLSSENFWTLTTLVGVERWWGALDLVTSNLGVSAPLPNVWLGISCEDQRTADERIPPLLRTLATVRFISAEPFLGPLDLVSYLVPLMHVTWGNTDLPPSERERPTDDDVRAVSQLGRAVSKMQGQAYLDWVIVGGESGPVHRPMELEWARSIRDQCITAGVPFFFKQWGGRTPKAGGRQLDGRVWDEMPRVPA